MRPLLRTSAFGLLGLALVAACSGASGQDVFEPNGGASSSGTSGTAGTSGGASGTSGTAGSSGGVADAAVDAPTPCPAETEPNDSRDSANTIAPTLCGIISPESESDFLAFQLKPAATTLAITFTGQVTLKVSVAGQSVTLTGMNNVKVPFFRNQRYTVEVKAAQKLPNIAWRVDVIET